MSKKRLTKTENLTTEVVDVIHSLQVALLQERVIGMSPEEAQKVAFEEKKTVRITREDDKYHIGTRDFSPNRLNIEIEKGLVVRAAIG